MGEAKDKCYTIGIMTGDTQSDYSEELMKGFYVAAQEECVNLVMLMGPQMPSYCADIISQDINKNYNYQFNSIYQYSHFMKLDAAIITCGSLTNLGVEKGKEDFFKQLPDIPFFILEDEFLGKDMPYFIADNYAGMKECVEHLIVDHGYKKIAFLSGPVCNYDATERLIAYKDTMQQHGLEVTDTMVVYGDFTDRVEDKVVYLLENNPGLEAIVSANDAMAMSCYRVCTRHNFIVGKDIAITGFDDINAASTMNPPLTSVSQNSFKISYNALKETVAMCRGQKPAVGKQPAVLKKRCSCGCAPSEVFSVRYVPQEEMGSFVKMAIEQIAQIMFSNVSYQKEYDYLVNAWAEFLTYIYDKVFVESSEDFSMEYLLDILRKIAKHPAVPSALLVENIEKPLQVLMANAKDANTQRLISSIISSTQQVVHSLNIQRLEKEIYMTNRKSWFVPTFTGDLASETYMRNPQGIFYCVMDELKKMNVRSVYFVMFDTPVICTPGEALKFPEQMSLVAYFDSENMRFYSKAEQPKISKDNGFASFVAGKDPACYVSILLFSENKQYGFMVCRADREDIPFLQICSIQLGTLFHFIELNMLEQNARAEVQSSLKIIQEKNTILSFLSENDELTGLLNRRGFIDKAITMYKENLGKRAYLIFGDLDHLKQINDIYGHAEGDYSIKRVAKRMQMILPEDAICSRMGGDEFVAFIITDEEDFVQRVKQDFASVSKLYNQSSNKPYYIEMSIGIHEFICNEDIDFDEMLKKSDELLYEAKVNRRKSVTK